MNGSEYPDHRSPVRTARERARRRLPCQQCSSVHEPVIRRAPYLSPAWRRSPAAYFACADCGMRLEELTGSAAFRDSDLARDRFPDSSGALAAFNLAGALEETAGTRRVVPDAEEVAALLSGGVSGLAPSISARFLETDGEDFGAGVGFKVNGAPWMLVAVEVPGHGERLDLTATIGDLHAYGYIPLIDTFVICLASETFWFHFDREPGPPGDGRVQLVSACELTLGNGFWQLRTYRPLPDRITHP